MTRNGKIARLPRWVREQLNRRLADGQQGKSLVKWLNSREEVQEVMEVEFDDRPVTEQNLSEWKKGGFQDWLHHQESREWARLVCEDASELSEESGMVPLSDRLGSMMALALGRMIQKACAGSMDAPETRRELLALSRELAVLRGSDHQAARIRMELEERLEAKEQRAELAEKSAQNRKEWEPIQSLMQAMSKEAVVRQLTTGMDVATENRLRELLKMPLNGRNNGASAPQGQQADPTQSD